MLISFHYNTIDFLSRNHPVKQFYNDVLSSPRAKILINENVKPCSKKAAELGVHFSDFEDKSNDDVWQEYVGFCDQQELEYFTKLAEYCAEVRGKEQKNPRSNPDSSLNRKGKVINGSQ